MRERHTNPGATLQKQKPREQAANIVVSISLQLARVTDLLWRA